MHIFGGGMLVMGNLRKFLGTYGVQRNDGHFFHIYDESPYEFNE